MFYKKPSRVIITQGNNNHMPSITSNNRVHTNEQEDSTVEKNDFRMAPLLLSAYIWAIYTIHLKYGLIRPF